MCHFDALRSSLFKLPPSMAGGLGAAVIFLKPGNRLSTVRKKPLLSASIRTVSRLKPLKRKNHLRPKILRIPAKPNVRKPRPPPSQQPQTEPIVPIVSPETSVHEVIGSELLSEQVPVECCPAAAGEGDNVEQFRLSETATTAMEYGNVGKFPPFKKLGVYLLGAFLFHTICAVWVIGNAKSDKRDESSESSGTSSERTSQRELLLNEREKILRGGFGTMESKLVYLDLSLLDEKIEEIKAMAREARNTEKRRTEDGLGSDDFEDSGTNSQAKIGIEKEIDARLVKLQKNLNSSTKGSYVNYFQKTEKVDEIDGDGLDVEGKGKLMFKKKVRFRGSSTEPKNKPPGFGVKTSSDSSILDATEDDGTATVDGLEVLKEENLGDRGLQESVSGTVKNGDRKRLVIEKSLSSQKYERKRKKGMKRTNRRNGVQEKSSVEASNASKSKEMETQKLQSFSKGNGDTSATSDNLAALGLNGTPAEEESVADEARREKQLYTNTNMWWSRLPYVLAIFMRRASQSEGTGGLYTLKAPGHMQDQKDKSYIVAFEDRVDANNFCYLLESFFEDLGDFTADIVPLTTKELRETVKSNTSNIIVVKKRQLQLYAGQPFSDVEKALHDLVEGNQVSGGPNSR